MLSPGCHFSKGSGLLPRCTTEVRNAVQAAKGNMIQCEVIYLVGKVQYILASHVARTLAAGYTAVREE